MIRRGPGVVGAPTVPGADAATLRTGAGAFSARLELVTAPALDAATAFLATPPPEAVPVAGTGSDLSDAFLAGGLLLGLDGAPQTLGVGLPADAVRLRVLNGG